MSVDLGNLPVDVRNYISGLEQQIKEVSQEKDQWKTRYTHTLEQLQLAIHNRFGRSTEKFVYDENQISMLFTDESEPLPENCDPEGADQATETTEVSGYTRTKKRKAIPDDAPEVIIYHDIEDDEKQCGCGSQRKLVKTIKTKKLGYLPEQHYVETHIQLVYGCKTCEGSGDEEKPALLTAPKEKAIIPKGIATPSLLAGIFTNKFCDHLPYYRQSQRFFRSNIQISRQDMSNWQQKVYESAIKPLVQLLNQHILSYDFLQLDETTTRVQKEPGKADSSQSYIWVARGGPPDKPAVTYTYKDNRSHQHPRNFLETFRGYAQADGFSAYDTAIEGINDIFLIGCHAHSRRKFNEAWIASKKKSERAAQGIRYIKDICKIDEQLREKKLPVEEFMVERKKQTNPILREFYAWCKQELLKTPPESLLGKAFTYTIKQWDKLVRYLEHPDATPTNNGVENIIRPYVLGRKNWLQNGSPTGAESACGLFSVIQTAVLYKLNVFVYLNYIFTEIPKREPGTDLSDLLPFNIDLDKLKKFSADQIPNLYH